MILRPAEFLPDQPEIESTGATEAKNVIAAAQSYRPLKTLTASGSAASTVRIQGAVTLRSTDLSIKSFAGDATKLYGYDGSAWSDFTRAVGGAYATPSTGMWQIRQFGDTALAVNGVDDVQSIGMSAGTAFANATGSPPSGSRYIAICDDVAVLARNTADAMGIAWSDIRSLDWTTGSADSRTVYDGGQLMGLFAIGSSFVVLQEHCFRLWTRSDYPVTFTRGERQDKGCLCEWATAQHENLIFFIAPDGFYLLVGGQQLQAIGAEKVNRFFFEHPSHGVDLNNLHRVTGVVDPVNKLWVISYPSVGGGTGEPDKMLVYNFEVGRWTRAEVGCDMVFSAMVQSSWNLDNIDTLIGNLDATSLSLDDPAFTGSGRVFFAGFTSAHELGFFNGANMAATVTTGEAQLSAGRRSLVTGVRPFVDGGTPSVTLGTRNLPGDSVSWGSAVAMNDIGLCPFRSDARFHRAQIDMAAGGTWSHIIGIEPEFRASGYR